MGNNVRDEYFKWAEFAELISSPPSMEASRAAGAVGRLEGYLLKHGDATGAYTQSYLLDVDTWVCLPEHRWPKHGVVSTRTQMVPLILALYGHPDAGGRWEAHCEKYSCIVGFVKIAEEWTSLYWHPQERAVLLVYVDDFKLAARREHHDELWKGLRSVIDMGLSLIHI